jgi:hypothetical protein
MIISHEIDMIRNIAWKSMILVTGKNHTNNGQMPIVCLAFNTNGLKFTRV